MLRRPPRRASLKGVWCRRTRQSLPAVSQNPPKRRRQESRFSRSPNAVVPVRQSRCRPLGVLAVQSGSALVVEQAGGDAIYQKNAAQVVPIASITKLMTAMVVLDGSPALQTPITISDDDVDYLRGSRSRLHVGSVLSRESALLLALMSSENRAANALVFIVDSN